MNKLIFFSSLAFFISLHLTAQKSKPPIGKIDKGDLVATYCPYDKTANAFKLIDWASVSYEKNTHDGSFKTIYKKRERIKICNENGLNYANISIPFYSYNNIERITKILAYTFNIEDNKITTIALKKNATYSKAINKYYTALIIPFSNAKPGSVIEYEYTLESESIGHLKDWNFQDKIPTQYSEYELHIPMVYTFTISPSLVDSMITTERIAEEMINTEQGVVRSAILHKTFVMQNLKALPTEPFMGAVKDYQQRLQFQLAQINYGKGEITDLNNTWEDVITTLKDDPDFAQALENKIPETENFLTELKTKKQPLQKFLFAYDYFQKNFNWNKYESVYSYKSQKEIWQTKTGTTADINLLFIHLLKAAGLTSYPILFSTRDNGTVNTYLPFIEQFNTTLCYVSIDNMEYVIDATDKFLNYKLVPQKVLNCNGLIINDSIGKWFFATNTNKHKVTIAAKGIVDESGIIKAETIVNASGYNRYNRLKSLTNSNTEFIDTYFNQKKQHIELTDLQIKNTEDNSVPLEQKATYTFKTTATDKYHYFNTNIFTDFTKNPFTSEERLTDIEFGYLQEYRFFLNYLIPYNYEFIDLPQNITFVMPDNSITISRFVEVEENKLDIRINIDFKSALYSATNYPDFAAFYKKIYEILNEQIAIKKK